MSLDVVILGGDGIPGATAAIGLDDCARRMDLAAAEALPLLLRLSDDFYADATFTAPEIPAFLEELAWVSAASRDGTLLKLVAALRELALAALAGRRGLEALAD